MPAPIALLLVLVAIGVAWAAVGAGSASAAETFSWQHVEVSSDCGGLSSCWLYVEEEGEVWKHGLILSEAQMEEIGGPRTADVVLEGNTLTPEAQAVVEDPATAAEAISSEEALGGGSTVAAGVEAGGEAAAAFEVGGVLPVLAPAAVAFGVGYGLGKLICNSVFSLFGSSSCFGEESENTQESFAAGGWSLVEKGGLVKFGELSAGPVPPMSYVWSVGTQYIGNWTDEKGQCGLTAPVPPGEVDHWYPGTPASPCAATGTNVGAAVQAATHGLRVSSTTKSEASAKGWPSVPSSSQNYCTAGLATACNSHSPPVDWPERMAQSLAEPVVDPHVAGRVAHYVASRVPESGVGNPYSKEATVPNCVGRSYEECVALLEADGLVPVRNTLGWEAADVSRPASAVTATAPAASSVVEKGATVTVTVNPAFLPLVVPAFSEGESYSEYVASLPAGLKPERVDRGEAATDPHVGPNAVLHVAPAPQTRLDPATEHELEVQTNPANAPAPSTSSWSPPGIDPIDLSPITSLHVGCGEFPFGIFCWLKDGLTSWGPGGECPSIDLPFAHFNQGPEVGEFKEAHLESSTCGFEPAMEIVRPTLVVLATLSIAAMFAFAALGIGGSAGTDD